MRATPLLAIALAVGCDLEEAQPAVTGTTPTGTPTVIEEVLTQQGTPDADVLIVADADLLVDVLDDVPVLLDYGLGQGWHLGITSTGLGGAPDEVGRIAWTDVDADPNPAASLGAVLPVAGPNGAMGAIDGALNVLDATLNAGFRRGGPLHVVVVSTTDDATPYGDPVAFSSWLQGLGTEVSLSVSAPATATTYLDLAATLGGVVSDIDVDPLAPFLEAAGLAATGLTRTFPLSSAPVPGTVEVEVEPPALPGNEIVLVFVEGVDFTLGPDAAITFDEYVPEPGAKVRVRYEPAP